jgi:tRNA(fMet)-specific endonuclease VapC
MVIDTSLFIEHLRAKNKTQTTLFQLSSTELRYASAITVYELLTGATDAMKIASVRHELQGLLILPFTTQVSEKAAEISHNLRRRGLMIELPDSLIAATALVSDLPIKTLNIRHFERVEGLVLV